MSDPRIDIQIKTTADVSGVNQAEQGLKRVEAAAKQSSQATGQLAGQTGKATAELGKLSQAGAAGTQVLSGLERAAQGGISAILGVAQAFRGFLGLVRTAVASSGPIGILVTVLGLAAGAFAIFRTRTTETADAQRKLDATLKATTASAIELNKVKLSALRAEIEATTAAAQSLLNATQKALDLQGRKDAAETEAAIAGIEASSDLTPDEKARRVASLRAGLTDRQRAREDAARDAQVSTARETFQTRERAATEAETMAASQRAKVTRIEQADVARRNRIDEIQSLLRNPDALMPSASEIRPDQSRQGVAIERANALRRELQQLQTAQAISESPVGRATLDRERKILEDQSANARSARDAASSARQQFETTYTNYALETRALPSIRTAEDRRTGIQSNTSLLGILRQQRDSAESQLPDINRRFDSLVEEERGLSRGWDTERSNQISAELFRLSAQRDELNRVIGDFARAEAKANDDLKRTLKNTSESRAGR